MQKSHFIPIKIAPWVLLAVFAFICYISQKEKSVTVDEFIYLPSGLYKLLTFDWRMDRENPPLILGFPALTTLISKPDIAIKPFVNNPNPYDLGYDFMFRNSEKYRQVFQLGRYAVILLAVLCGWLLYKFALEIYGFRGGLLALFLYVFNPNIIAHSRLTTIDMGATLTIFLSFYCFWKYLKKESWANAIIAGVVLGIAQLSKFSALILYPILILIFAILKTRKEHVNDSQVSFFRSMILFVTLLAVSLFIINAGYFFSRPLTPLSEFNFLSNGLKQFSELSWEGLRVPLPYEYLKGFDMVLAIAEGNNPFYGSYLMGEHSLHGWWYYYFIAFFVKNPLPLLLIIIFTVYVWVKERANRPNFETGLCIWVPVIVFFAYLSFFTHIPIGIRWLLPTFPFLFLAAGSLANANLMKARGAKVVMVLTLTGHLISTIHVFPDYLSYFNLAAGGPGKGHRWLIDSNLDWGQDLPGLKKYMERNGIKKIKLGYFGRVDPKIYGIDYELAKKEVEKGFYAISVNFLVGRPYYLLKKNLNGLLYVDLNYFKNYRLLKPLDVIGHTIHIFDLNGKDS